MNELSINEKIERINNYFNFLADVLSKDYEVMGSCNADISKYLIPKGTSSEVTYYGKPVWSYRISNHWNWYANSNSKCTDRSYVQCRSLDVPRANKRPSDRPWGASEPISAYQIAIFGPDLVYHSIYGETFDRKTNTWHWNDGGYSFNYKDPEVFDKFKKIYGDVKLDKWTLMHEEFMRSRVV